MSVYNNKKIRLEFGRHSATASPIDEDQASVLPYIRL